jgi:hypothetical protein
MARIVRRRGWKRLASGAHIRTDDPEDVDEVVLEKRAMYTTAEVDELIREHLKDVEPGLSYGDALQKRYADPGLQELFDLYSDPEPAPVTKADDGDTPAWRAIKKAARRLVEDAEGALTFAEAVEQTVYARPRLYEQYCRELAGLEE